MKIVIDQAIPFIEGAFEPFAEVIYAPGQSFTPQLINDADALIIRTRTRCNEMLLRDSSVRHIATATIGFDHIDLDYCKAHNIEVTTAAGCNARGVLQWVSAALVDILSKRDESPSALTLGVVGVGNVGRLIDQYARSWGFTVLCCDPPRKENEGGDFITLEELITQCDIVTFHTPLNATTYHMLNSQNIEILKEGATIINTSRGEVIESQALVECIGHDLYLDVWEEEPNIPISLLSKAIASTPHIAGYTQQGKANGTAMVVASVAKRLHLPIDNWYPDIEKVTARDISLEELKESISSYFDLSDESQQLKEKRELFEQMRNGYNYRCEYF